MSDWTKVGPASPGDAELLPGEVPEGTPGAVPCRYGVDVLGRRVPVAWTVPAAGAEQHWT